MKLTVDDILGRVRKTEDELSDYTLHAEQWEKMYCLDPGFTKGWKEAIEQDGREVIITPDPYNVVNLAMRLLANQPSINVPARSSDVKHIDTAKKIERWLQGMWWTLSRNQGRNLIRDGGWQSYVRGKHVFQVAWIKDVLPEFLQKERFPILVRTLEPLNVGIKRGPLYTEWAYHKYKADKVTIRNQYPNLAMFEEKDMQDIDEYEVIDWYHTDPSTGKVWNCVVVDGGTVIKRGKQVGRNEFAKPLKETIYPIIPIICGNGDSAPVANPAYESISLLHPMDGLWQYKCRLTSNMGTGVLWATWPFFMIIEPEGQTLPKDIVVRPGATEVLAHGTDYKQIMPDFNLAGLEKVSQQVDVALQQSAFPAVMYGETGGTTSGWQVNLLSDTARGRILAVIDSMERTVQSVNELVLALVEKMGGKDGVELYALDSASKKTYSETLTAEDIGGYYRNIVTLKPSVPKDEAGNIATGVRLYEAKLISGETMRDKFVPDLPADEETRIWLEQMQLDPEMQPRIKLSYLKQAMPETWDTLIKGSQFEQLAIQMDLLPQRAPMMPPNGIPGGIAPIGPGLGGPPPGMPPPGMMPPPGPPSGPGMSPSPMPPPGLMPPMGAPPPMSGPPLPPGLGAGLPPPMMPPPPVQPPAELIGALGGGFPPVMQGQLGPQNMNLPPDTDPLLFAELMGRQVPPDEELAMLQAQGGL